LDLNRAKCGLPVASCFGICSLCTPFAPLAECLHCLPLGVSVVRLPE